MAKEIRTIGVMTSGGDSQGMNACVRAVVRSALNKGLKVVSLIAFPSAIGLMTTSDYLIPLLFGRMFLPSAIVLKYLGILILVFSTAYLLGHIVLMAAGREKSILTATIFGAVVNTIINLILIPSYKEVGAAIASIGAEIIVTVVLLFYSHHYFNIVFDRRFVLSECLALVMMTIGIIIEKHFLSYSVVSTIVIVVTAIVLYAFGLIVSRNEMLISVFRRIKPMTN